MNKRQLLVLITVCMFCLSACFGQIHAQPETQTIHNLTSDLNYDTIQEAINAPETLDGHVIFVEAGTYYENILVSKSIELRGDNKETTILDGNNTNTVISIGRDRVTVTGFTIQNAKGQTFSAGVSVSSTRMGNIIENNILNCEIGIMLTGASDVRMVANTIRNCSVGLWMQGHASNNAITRNMFEDNAEGLHIEDSTSNSIYGNTVTTTGGEGIYLSNSDSNNLEENVVTNSVENGVVLTHCSENTLIQNEITNSTRNAVWLQNADNNNVSQNIFQSNGGGVFLTESQGCNIVANDFKTNIVGVTVSVSDENLFYSNNFVDNTEQVVNTNSVNSWDNGAQGNHWSDYQGTYNNTVGETPYVIDGQNQDNFPAMETFVIPEFSTMVSLLAVMTLVLVVTIHYKQKLGNKTA
ncbi:MAG: right-handed parallel beta-helix repeat-containing protein [Candidatus Bathyarchaeota archaeon]|nr:right-handed parallel beta-helix repeat-containing protein [Candidatus Bathyarchaeota archaeon]